MCYFSCSLYLQYFIYIPYGLCNTSVTDIVNSLESFIHDGQNVLVIWKHSCEDKVGGFVNILKQRVGPSGSVHLEHCDRLSQADYGTSSFDCCLIGFLSLDEHHQKPTFVEVARLLKPCGKTYLFCSTVKKEVGSQGLDEASLRSAFKLSGFSDIKTHSVTSLGPNSDSVSGVIIDATKPSFEVGSSKRLLFANDDNTQLDVRKVWSLDLDLDAEDVELVNDDDLLDEIDLNKPADESLRMSCDPKTKKRKACANCSCGLAEELNAEDTVKQKSVTSSCGSCYLGDAFRCASCPYLGMPAFKPGSNVKLSTVQMNADT